MRDHRQTAPSSPAPPASDHRAEVAAGQRFEFGKNWRRFLAVIDEERIRQAESSLLAMLGERDLQGRRFLDIGSGSGLFSLAARRLGATVHSVDYDPEAVACARELKARFYPTDPGWTIQEGSVLDMGPMEFLGEFDVVYSWGVLHHTGDMWRALDHARLPLAAGGALLIAIYNDQGLRSIVWRWVKRLYCSGALGRWTVTATFFPIFGLLLLGADLARRRDPFRRYASGGTKRGMSEVHNWADWLGGYPFEVAKPEQIVEFYRQRGLELLRIQTTSRLGNNEFVFRKLPAGADAEIQGERPFSARRQR